MWMVEGGSPNSLLRRGVTKESLHVGIEIVVDAIELGTPGLEGVPSVSARTSSMGYSASLVANSRCPTGTAKGACAAARDKFHNALSG